jgi:hypothetical protein
LFQQALQLAARIRLPMANGDVSSCAQRLARFGATTISLPAGARTRQARAAMAAAPRQPRSVDDQQAVEEGIGNGSANSSTDVVRFRPPAPQHDGPKDSGTAAMTRSASPINGLR